MLLNVSVLRNAVVPWNAVVLWDTAVPRNAVVLRPVTLTIMAKIAAIGATFVMQVTHIGTAVAPVMMQFADVMPALGQVVGQFATVPAQLLPIVPDLVLVLADLLALALGCGVVAGADRVTQLTAVLLQLPPVVAQFHLVLRDFAPVLEDFAIVMSDFLTVAPDFACVLTQVTPNFASHRLHRRCDHPVVLALYADLAVVLPQIPADFAWGRRLHGLRHHRCKHGQRRQRRRSHYGLFQHGRLLSGLSGSDAGIPRRQNASTVGGRLATCCKAL